MKKNNFKIVELKPEKNKTSVKRSVLIKNFIIEEIIGIHQHEKIKNQLPLHLAIYQEYFQVLQQ